MLLNIYSIIIDEYNIGLVMPEISHLGARWRYLEIARKCVYLRKSRMKLLLIPGLNSVGSRRNFGS